jgi:hypothetical protein
VENYRKEKISQISVTTEKDGIISADVNFDEFHLESLLTRVRQFLYRGELFYYKELRRSMVQEFGESSEFIFFYSKLTTYLNTKFKPDSVEVFVNGKDVFKGRTYKDLLEAKLYLGAIHSNRRINSGSETFISDMVNAHVIASKHLTFKLSPTTMGVVQNIFNFRFWIYRMAVESGKSEHLSELVLFGDRVSKKNLS